MQYIVVGPAPTAKSLRQKSGDGARTSRICASTDTEASSLKEAGAVTAATGPRPTQQGAVQFLQNFTKFSRFPVISNLYMKY